MKEIEAIDSPHPLPQDFLSLLLAKTLIQEGSYREGKESRREVDREKLQSAMCASSAQMDHIAALSKTQPIADAGLFCLDAMPWSDCLKDSTGKVENKKVDILFAAIGSADQSQYEAALGEAFWKRAEFQAAAPPQEQPSPNPDQKTNQKLGFVKSGTALLTIGVALGSLWALLGGRSSDASATEKADKTEKSFWAQPRKYLGLLGLLGASAMGLYLWKQQSKQGIAR